MREAPEQIILGMQLLMRSPNWVLHRCVITMSYFSGLQGHDLQALKVDGVREMEDGIGVDYEHVTRKGE